MVQQINLYDAALERRRDWLALENVVAGAVILLVAVGLHGALARVGLPALASQAANGETQLKAVRDQVVALGQQVTNRKPDPVIEQQVATQRQLLALRGEMLATLRHSLGPEATSFAATLRGFAQQTVSGLWLTGFSIDAGGGIEISGRTIDPALLPEYIRRLNREAAFRGQTFAALKLGVVKTEKSPGGDGKPAVESRPQWHEFMLIPVRSKEAEAAQGSPASGGRAG
jgi:hypothetical protein